MGSPGQRSGHGHGVPGWSGQSCLAFWLSLFSWNVGLFRSATLNNGADLMGGGTQRLLLELWKALSMPALSCTSTTKSQSESQWSGREADIGTRDETQTHRLTFRTPELPILSCTNLQKLLILSGPRCLNLIFIPYV